MSVLGILGTVATTGVYSLAEGNGVWDSSMCQCHSNLLNFC